VGRNGDCLRGEVELSSVLLNLNPFNRYSVDEGKQLLIYLCFSHAFSIFSHSVLLDRLERDGLFGGATE